MRPRSAWRLGVKGRRTTALVSVVGKLAGCIRFAGKMPPAVRSFF
jgi:hypothetical protein